MKKILALLAFAVFSTGCFGFNVSVKNNATGMPRLVRGPAGWKVKLASTGNNWITAWKQLERIGTTKTFTKQTKGSNKGQPLPPSFVIQIQTRGKYRATAGATKYFTLRKDVSGVSSNKEYVIRKKAGRSGSQENHYELVEK